MIKDSGDRTEFPTGAVRDMKQGKGRCDLLPLGIAGRYLSGPEDEMDNCLINIERFKRGGDPSWLRAALRCFVAGHKEWVDDATMLLEVSKHFEEGAEKYGENNWQKGIDVWSYIDSAVRHYLKWRRGDTDEPHDRAFCWNILCAWWTCEHKPELNGYAKAGTAE